MEFDCLAPNEVPGYTPLYTAYISGAKRLSEFYAYPPTLAAIVRASRELKRGKNYPRSTRIAVADTLADQNSRFSSGVISPSVARNLDSLREGAVAVVTGQQSGLFGGPAYTIYKALSALRIVRELHQRGVEAVPIFWIASTDHDLDEVSHCDWISRSGAERFELHTPDDERGREVGRVELGNEVVALAKRAGELLEGPGSEILATALIDSYQPKQTFGSAFAKLLSHIFSSHGLILLDPIDLRLQQLAAPVLAQIPAKHAALNDALLARGKQLTHLGFHAQVKVTASSTLLFGTEGGKRTAIAHRNGKFLIGAKQFTAAELAAEIERSPQDFTPNALLRPVIQDTLLPTVAYVGGPAEVAYFAQSQVLYADGLAHMPVIAPRASFTLVEPSLLRVMEKYRVGITDVLRGRQHLRQRLEYQSLPRGMDSRFVRGEKEMRSLLRGMEKPIAKLDATLRGALGTAERKMLFQFDKLRRKAGRALDLRNGILTRHETMILETLYPHSDLQERSISFLPFLANHGAELLDALSRHAGIGAPAHQVVHL